MRVFYLFFLFRRTTIVRTKLFFICCIVLDSLITRILNKGKYIVPILFLLIVLFPLVSSAGLQPVSRQIAWRSPVKCVMNDSVIKLLSFEGAVYQGVISLPVWNEDFYNAEYSENVVLANCIYIPPTDAELKLIQSFSVKIPAKIIPEVIKIMSRKQAGINVSLTPFKIDSVSGQVVKLSSFTLKFGSRDSKVKAVDRVYAANSVFAQGNWYKIGITQTGIHSIGYNDLVAMGISPAAIDPSRIGIFGRGGTMLPEPNAIQRADDVPENAIEVTGQGDGSFDQGDLILFYAQGPVSWNFNKSQQMWEHTTHLYADTIIYFLTTDRGTGKRISVKSNSTQTETDQVTAFDYYAGYEENNVNILGSGRRWFAQTYDVIVNKSFSFDIPPLAAGGEVKVYSATAAKSYLTSTFGFSASGQSWTVYHSAVPNYSESPVASPAYSYKSLQSVTLPFKIDVRYNKPEAAAAGYLDLIDVYARCELRFVAGQLGFCDTRSCGTGHIAQYHLADAAGKVRLWDVTDPLKVAAVDNHTDGNVIVFKLSSDTLRQFIAFDASKLLKPVFFKKISNQNLHASTGSDMIIIAPQIFMPQAVRLATFHASVSDLSVQVLDPETIYNEFSSGTRDITAIRDYLKMLYDKATMVNMPKYLLLFGDASYDYKDKTPSNSNFVPTWESPESFDPISSIVSDDYFGTLDNNEGQSYYDRIDIGIGRLPVQTALEAEQVVDKIIHYAVPSAETQGDWRNVITFVADDEDYDHVAFSEEMAADIESSDPEINLDKIYLDSYIQIATPGGNRYPEANKAISQRVEKGCLMINYTGHGGEKGWAHEEVLTVNEIKNWSNLNNLPVFATATCEFSRFDDPVRQAAGEYVLTNPKGGGIALFTSTRATYGSPSFELNKKIFEYSLSKPGGERLCLGDIIMNAKRDKGADDNGRKYVLLGDPALKIAFPELNVSTTSINGKSVSASPDTLKAFMEVTIEGMITDEQGKIVSGFNGSLVPSVFDKPVSLKTLGNDGGSIFSFKLQKNLLYKGKVVVENGRFRFSFVVPKDIAYPYGAGKISYFASDGTRDASGLYANVIIGGSSATASTDNTGPEIRLFLNNLLFRDGGITDQNPRLLVLVSDESGINTIGNGIGHDITAILDDNSSEPFILNDFYESDLDTYKSGYIWFPFTFIEPGEHTLTVKVWDVFNNSTEAEIHFKVLNSGEFVITDVRNYPNPFREYTNIVFEHNQQNVEFSTRVEIYSITGKLVKVVEQTAAQIGSVSTPIKWDGTGSNGSAVPAGMYLCRLSVRTSNGFYAEKTGKMIYIR